MKIQSLMIAGFLAFTLASKYGIAAEPVASCESLTALQIPEVTISTAQGGAVLVEAVRGGPVAADKVDPSAAGQLRFIHPTQPTTSRSAA